MTLRKSAVLLLVASGCGSTEPVPVSPSQPAALSDAVGAPAETGPSEQEQIAAIQWAVNQTSDAIHHCYAVEMAREHRVQGEVVVRLEIADDGTTTDVVIKRDSTGRLGLLECMTKVWKAFRFPRVFDDGDRIQLPPVTFEAGNDQYVISTKHAVTPDGSRLKTALVSQSNTNNTEATIDLFTIGKTTRFPRYDSPQFLYVLAGTGTIRGSRGKPIKLAPGVGAILPTTSFQYQHKGVEPLVAIRATANIKVRSPRGEAIATAKAPEYEIAGGKGNVRILFEGVEGYMGAVTFDKDIQIPKHQHESSSEFMYMLAGTGELYIGDIAYTVKAGDAIQIPRGTVHAFVGSGDEPIKALQWYFPGGPEQRFKTSGK